VAVYMTPPKDHDVFIPSDENTNAGDTNELRL